MRTKAHPAPRRFRHALIPASCLVALLAACGSGSDDEPDAGDPATLSITGTAAVGAALAGGTVEASCATGSGSTPTGDDGTYEMTIEDGTLPCALRVTSADGTTVLHSAAVGSGAEARANLTPLTELVMAQLTGQVPAAAYAAFDPSALTTAALQAAVAEVAALLAAGGTTLPADPVSGALAVGDAHDQVLDALAANLAAGGITLEQAVAALLASIAPAGTVPPPGTPALPPAQLLAAAAPNCAALRSGTYRLLFAGPDSEEGIETLTLDAPALNATVADGETRTLIANGPCRYTLANGGDLVVSASGVGVLRSQEAPGQYWGGMMFPEQVHPVSVTQGEWNLIGLADTTSDDGSGPRTLFSGAGTIDAEGRLTAITFCEDVRNCVEGEPFATEVHVPNPAGGFDFDGGRHFAYRAGNGAVMLAGVDSDGGFMLLTPKVASVLPVVGAVSRSWNVTIAADYSANPALGEAESTVRSVDAASGTYLRDAVINFDDGTTRPEQIEINVFLDGFLHRIAETVTTSTGANSNVSEWVALGMRGMGFTAVGLLANNSLILATAKVDD